MYHQFSNKDNAKCEKYASSKNISVEKLSSEIIKFSVASKKRMVEVERLEFPVLFWNERFMFQETLVITAHFQQYY